MDFKNMNVEHQQLPWWVHSCHIAWVVLSFFWGTVFVGFLINFLASVFFLSQGTNLQTLYIGHILNWGSKHLFILMLVVITMLIFTALIRAGSRQKVSQRTQLVFAVPGEHAHAVLRKDGPIYRARYKRRYIRYLSFRFDNLDVSGLPRRLEQGLDLLPVFVDLSLSNKAVHHASSDPIKPSDIPQYARKDIWDYLVNSKKHLVILGAPGSGKTTLLKYVAISLPKQNRQAHPTSYRLPFLLLLREHQDDIRSNPTFFLAKAIEKDLHRWGLPSPPGWVNHQLTKKKCLILLDGLDEVANQETRRCVVDWVQRQMSAYNTCLFVMTSRPYGYLENELSNTLTLEVQPFTSEQISLFIRNWYQVRENAREGRPDERMQRKLLAEEEANDLLQRLQRTKQTLRKLAANPLLLTMIVMIHCDRSTLPENRVELYKEVCEVFLGRRDEARNLPITLRPPQQQLVLEHLAYYLMQEKAIMVNKEKSIELIKGPLEQVDPQLPPEEFLRLLKDRGGLFLENELGAYGFTHKVFQEYLAAVHIKKSGSAQELVAKIDDEWWRETILLYCAQSDASELIKACRESDPLSVRLLELAWDINKIALQVKKEERDNLNALFNQEIKDLIQQRTVAEASLSICLSDDQMVPLSEKEDVFASRSLIKCIVFQLFLDEQLTEGSMQIAFPDHWKDVRFPPGQAQKPVLGMRFVDAKEFCKWLNDWEEGTWHYRLPTSSEKNLVTSRLEGVGEQSQGCRFWFDPRIDWKRGLWPSEGAPKLKVGQFRERLTQDYFILKNALQDKNPADIETCFNTMHELTQARTLHDELAHTLTGIQSRLRKSERDLIARHTQVKSVVDQHETNLNRLQKKQTALKAELTDIESSAQRRQRAEDNILYTRNNMDRLSEKQSQMEAELVDVKKEIGVTKASIERENRRWFPNQRRLNELQTSNTDLMNQEKVLEDQRVLIQQQLNYLNRKLSQASHSSTQQRTTQQLDHNRNEIENQLAHLQEQEKEEKANYEVAYELQTALQAQLSQLAIYSDLLTSICDQTLAFVLHYDSNKQLSILLNEIPGLDFDDVFVRIRRNIDTREADSMGELVNTHRDELLRDLAQFTSIASSEINIHELSKLTNLSHALSSSLDHVNFQHHIRLLDDTLHSFIAELIKHRPLGQASPILRAAIRYFAWGLGEHLTYWLSKGVNSATPSLRRVIDAYLNLAVSLALLEERIEEKMPPIEGIVLIRERRDQI